MYNVSPCVSGTQTPGTASGSTPMYSGDMGTDSSAFPWWIITIVVTILLFVINLTIAIWLHKKNKRRHQEVRPQKLRPMAPLTTRPSDF